MKEAKNSQRFTRANQNAILVWAIGTLARLDYEGFRRVSAHLRNWGFAGLPRSRRLAGIHHVSAANA